MRRSDPLLSNPLLGVPLLALLLTVAACECDNGGDDDAGTDASCTLAVTIGTGTASAFTPSTPGEDSELILGFQGFRMLELAVRVDGEAAPTAEIVSYASVEGTSIMADQRNRLIPIVEGSAGGVVEGHLIFFNDAPASELVGRNVDVELIVRSGGCTGTATVRLRIVDEEDCVDTMVEVPDAGFLDGGVPDGAVICMESM